MNDRLLPLQGKKILISSGDSWESLKFERYLQNQALADTKFTTYSPSHPGNIPSIESDMKAYKPDVLVIHWPELSENATDLVAAVNGVIKLAKERDIPVIYLGLEPSNAVKLSLSRQGVQCVDVINSPTEQEAYAVAGLLAQRARSGAPARA